MRKCRECNKEFIKVIWVTGNIYCSNDCRNIAMRRKHNLLFWKWSWYGRQHLPTTKNCKYCNKEFVTTKINLRTCCTPECYILYRKENGLCGYSKSQEKKCKVCGNKFITRRSTWVHCSKECAHITRLEQMKIINASRHPIIDKKCKRCGKDFTTSGTKKIYCNEWCRLDNKRALKKISIERKGV